MARLIWKMLQTTWTEQAVQGNIDPVTLFASKEVITDRVLQTVQKAGDKKTRIGPRVRRHPEEHVAHFSQNGARF